MPARSAARPAAVTNGDAPGRSLTACEHSRLRQKGCTGRAGHGGERQGRGSSIKIKIEFGGRCDVTVARIVVSKGAFLTALTPTILQIVRSWCVPNPARPAEKNRRELDRPAWSATSTFLVKSLGLCCGWCIHHDGYPPPQRINIYERVHKRLNSNIWLYEP